MEITESSKLPEWGNQSFSQDQLLEMAENIPESVLRKLNPAINGYLTVIDKTTDEAEKEKLKTLLDRERAKAVLEQLWTREKNP